jgi:hypothetical protein
MKSNLDKPADKAPHAPGAGSDKQHPDTPEDANERFNKQKKGNIQENPGKQNTG